MAIGEMKTGHTGKAVKTLEELAAKDAQNAWYIRGLAMAYLGRNWKNKAASAFSRALKAGAHDPEFIRTYMNYQAGERDWEEYFACIDTFYTHPVSWTRDYANDIYYIISHTENRRLFPEETCLGVVSFTKELVRAHLDILDTGYVVCKLLYEVETHAPKEVRGKIREIYPEVLEKTAPMDRDEGHTAHFILMQYRGALVQSYLRNTLGTSRNFARSVDDFIFETRADTDFPEELETENKLFIYDDYEGATRSLPFLQTCVPTFAVKYATEFRRAAKGRSEAYRMKKTLVKEYDRRGPYVRSDYWNNLLPQYSGGSADDSGFFSTGFFNGEPSEDDFNRILKEFMKRQSKGGGDDFPFPFF